MGMTDLGYPYGDSTFVGRRMSEPFFPEPKSYLYKIFCQTS